MGLQASCSEDELLDDSLGFHDLLYRLFHEEGVRVFEPRPLTDACRCSREKLDNVLKAMPRAEIEDLKKNWAVDRTRVVEGKSVSVRLALVGRRLVTKKKTTD